MIKKFIAFNDGEKGRRRSGLIAFCDFIEHDDGDNLMTTIRCNGDDEKVVFWCFKIKLTEI